MKKLKQLSQKIIAIQTTILLSVVYIVILPIFVLIQKFQQKPKTSGWLRWMYSAETLEDAKNQY